MARIRKARDYQAEQARRNALAKERGFRNRAEQRKAIETGVIAPLKPKQIRNPKTVDSYSKFRRRLKNNAQDYSAMHAKTWIAEYDYIAYVKRELRDGNQPLAETDYLDAYSAAWVVGTQRYVNVRRRGGSPALRHWLVNVIHKFTGDEYDERYGKVD